ncbi:MAG: hypothetical protein JWN78_817 [Bacteroidota bacterium]|nr:hypothetical protein [Bacteroidota bacterium]
MSTIAKKHTAFYQFLAPYLETGNAEVIAEAKIEYRKRYKQAWNKQRAQSHRTYKVSFTKKEVQVLVLQAQQLELTPTEYIKRLCITELQNGTYAPLAPLYNHIRAAIIRTHQQLSIMHENAPKHIDGAITVLAQLDCTLHSYLAESHSLEEQIRIALRKNWLPAKDIIDLVNAHAS